MIHLLDEYSGLMVQETIDFSAVALAVAGLHGFSVLKIDFDQLFAGRNSCDNLLGLRVDDGAAVGIGVSAVDAERDPAGVGPLLGVFEDRYVSNVPRRHDGQVVDINIAVNAID